MNNNQRRPILYKGEVYSSLIEKVKPFIPKEPSVSFEDSRIKILKDLESLNEKIKTTPSRLKLPNESIVCVRVQKEYVAKTFYPSALFGPSYDLEEIGSRAWQESGNEDTDDYGRLYFVRTTEHSISNLEKKLNEKNSELHKNFKLDIRKISAMDLLTTEEQILGFSGDWESGRLEAILHPFYWDRALAFSHFRDLLANAKGDVESINMKQYDEHGLTFISFNGDRDILKAISGYNPLRTVHPLTFRTIPEITR